MRSPHQSPETRCSGFAWAEDIDRIVSTYKDRSAQEKYSYVATLDEVKENDYNLNISRYVDTLEEEEQVDLEAVSTELRDLETAMTRTDKIISEYCQQLGIAMPS